MRVEEKEVVHEEMWWERAIKLITSISLTTKGEKTYTKHVIWFGDPFSIVAYGIDLINF